jgi:hypothetical protein
MLTQVEMLQPREIVKVAHFNDTIVSEVEICQ